MQDIMAPEAQALGRRLAWARELVSGSQSQLARDVGCQRSMIQKIEAGQRTPSLYMLQSICHVLRISPQYLTEGSLLGVDGELAAMLLERHPELRKRVAASVPGRTHKLPPSTARRPRKPARPSMVLAE